MKKNLTEIVFILDASGSMCSLKSDTIGGYNSLLEKQKEEEGEAYVSTIMFNTESKIIHDRIEIKEVPEMTKKDYVPTGCTAMLDAIGDAINHIKNIHRYIRDEDVPEKTMFVITTDGMENASKKYSYKDVKKLIEEQEKEYNWEFIFIGANIDSAKTAGDIGIKKECAVDYISDSKGTSVMWDSINEAVCYMRCMDEDEMPTDWREELDKDVKNRKKR